MPKKEVTPRPPWPTDVVVKYASDVFFELVLGTLRLDVSWDGTWTGYRDSRKEINEFMKKDSALTRRIQRDFEETYKEGGWSTWREKWLKGQLVSENEPRDPKDWIPGGKKRFREFGRIGQERSANTYNWDSTYWWGDVFEFTHFETGDGEEGAIIQWQRGGDARTNYSLPEVWMGSFEEFIAAQHETDPESAEALIQYSRGFDNTIIWAMQEMGLFREQVHVQANKDVVFPIPSQVTSAITEEPDFFLYPALVEDILAHSDFVHKSLYIEARKWVDRVNRKAEEEHGQGFLFPPPEEA